MGKGEFRVVSSVSLCFVIKAHLSYAVSTAGASGVAMQGPQNHQIASLKFLQMKRRGQNKGEFMAKPNRLFLLSTKLTSPMLY